MERRKQSKTRGSQDDSQDQVPSTSGCRRTPAAAVEPPEPGAGQLLPATLSEVTAPSPADCQNVFRRAVQEPNSLTTDDLKLLAVAICQSAIRKANYAIPAAEFCLTIIEMDCLRTALITAGAALERVAPERLAALMREIHATLQMQGLPIRSRHVLLELTELQASGWQLSPAQQPDLSSGTGR
ncbi:hypothetical protein HPB49_016801 [Dermacentor silvarum]|uniref:Uncharacterized protein n=1 Tax=Dermacentor silvarum TaxID=543639 RepID=A0ACB8CRY9_DERSI|nr:hypothetical protein HPB49_016801 [Dermacentor silvarum]